MGNAEATEFFLSLGCESLAQCIFKDLLAFALKVSFLFFSEQCWLVIWDRAGCRSKVKSRLCSPAVWEHCGVLMGSAPSPWDSAVLFSATEIWKLSFLCLKRFTCTSLTFRKLLCLMKCLGCWCPLLFSHPKVRQKRWNSLYREKVRVSATTERAARIWGMEKTESLRKDKGMESLYAITSVFVQWEVLHVSLDCRILAV